MFQVMKNLFAVFAGPFLVGAFLRLMVRKRKNPWILTGTFAVLLLFMWCVALFVPDRGSERYGILAWQASCLFGGSLATECLLLLFRRFHGRKRKTSTFTRWGEV